MSPAALPGSLDTPVCRGHSKGPMLVQPPPLLLSKAGLKPGGVGEVAAGGQYPGEKAPNAAEIFI